MSPYLGEMLKPRYFESFASSSRLSRPSPPKIVMANAHPTTRYKPLNSPEASKSDNGSEQSTSETTTTSRVNVRNSADVEIWLRSSNEGVHYLPSPSDDIQFMSSMTSLSKSYTIDEDKAIARIFDRRLVLFMALLYMLSFLDRSSQPSNLSSCHT